MGIQNVLASVAVNDLDAAARWYERVLGAPGSRPMPEVAEWQFDGGGGLQVYELPERAGKGSFTLAVSSVDEQVDRLDAQSVAHGEPMKGDRVNTLMIKDPDGNSIAFAEAIDPALAR
jgi:catechol 2,3-dioxygenase-like lactoylglutathione lyase family enzyme